MAHPVILSLSRGRLLQTALHTQPHTEATEEAVQMPTAGPVWSAGQPQGSTGDQEHSALIWNITYYAAFRGWLSFGARCYKSPNPESF